MYVQVLINVHCIVRYTFIKQENGSSTLKVPLTKDIKVFFHNLVLIYLIMQQSSNHTLLTQLGGRHILEIFH